MLVNDKILIPHSGVIHLIDQKNVIYFQADNCYTHVFLSSTQRYLLVKSLKKVTEELNLPNFIRVNQSYLVNKNHIEIIDKKQKLIVMTNNIKIPFTVKIKDLLIQITSQ